MLISPSMRKEQTSLNMRQGGLLSSYRQRQAFVEFADHVSPVPDCHGL